MCVQLYICLYATAIKETINCYLKANIINAKKNPKIFNSESWLCYISLCTPVEDLMYLAAKLQYSASDLMAGHSLSLACSSLCMAMN